MFGCRTPAHLFVSRALSTTAQCFILVFSTISTIFVILGAHKCNVCYGALSKIAAHPPPRVAQSNPIAAQKIPCLAHLERTLNVIMWSDFLWLTRSSCDRFNELSVTINYRKRRGMSLSSSSILKDFASWS
jgi:hypothetical protein